MRTTRNTIAVSTSLFLAIPLHFQFHWTPLNIAFFFVIFTAVYILVLEFAELLNNLRIDKKFEWEQKAFSVESQKLGFEVEDVEKAKYPIAIYLSSHPQTTTEDLFANVELPEAFKNDDNSIAALRLAGLITTYRYGMNSDTKLWSSIHHDISVKRQYRGFQKYIKARHYRKQITTTVKT